jgi:hypothetical protein
VDLPHAACDDRGQRAVLRRPVRRRNVRVRGCDGSDVHGRARVHGSGALLAQLPVVPLYVDRQVHSRIPTPDGLPVPPPLHHTAQQSSPSPRASLRSVARARLGVDASLPRRPVGCTRCHWRRTRLRRRRGGCVERHAAARGRRRRDWRKGCRRRAPAARTTPPAPAPWHTTAAYERSCRRLPRRRPLHRPRQHPPVSLYPSSWAPDWR